MVLFSAKKHSLDYLKISVTKSCNYSCSFCSQSDFLNNATLDFSVVEDKIFSLFVPRLIILTGGEPLTKPRIIKKYIGFCKDNNVELGIFTNISLLTEELAEIMSKLKKFWLRATVNGANAGSHEKTYPKGSFREMSRGIEIASRHGLKVKIRVTVTTDNHDEISAIIKLGSDLGVTEIDFRPYAPLSNQIHDKYMLNVEDHLKSLKTIIDSRKIFPNMKLNLLPNWFDYIVTAENDNGNYCLCNCGKTYLYIDSDGSILACAGYRNKLGNINSDNINQVYRESQFLKEVRKERFGKYCQSCPVYSICRRSNCHVINYEVFCTLNSVNPLCPIYRLSPYDVKTGFIKARQIYNS